MGGTAAYQWEHWKQSIRAEKHQPVSKPAIYWEQPGKYWGTNTIS